jgi:hypothetical protein
LCAKGKLKGKVGSIETEADALQACLDLHAAGPSKVLIAFLLQSLRLLVTFCDTLGAGRHSLLSLKL